MDIEPSRLTQAPSIPGYRIEGVLGRGATGIVYRARQISVDRLVALKVLHPELVGAKSAAQRLQREARATARLSHPNIISAIDMGQVDGAWWYAMELVDGQSLYERLRDRPMGEREALRLFIPLVEALQHAFERGIVHRDIKPGNVLVERGGARALLVDLGLAFASDDPSLTKSGATLGTPHYISPEQARDPAGADTQSDLWSLGATLFHAVTGRPPFSGESVAEILSAVLYSPVPDPRDIVPSVSKGFALVVRKCLARDRARRYQTPADLLADLELLRERRAPRVRAGALEPAAGENARRLKRAAIVAACALPIVAVVWFFARERSANDEALLPQRKSPDALAILDQMRSGPSSDLSNAVRRARELETSAQVSDADRPALHDSLVALEARLQEEIARWRTDGEALVRRYLDGAAFDAAERALEGEIPRDLIARIGDRPWPAAVEAETTGWLVELRARVRGARTRAVEAFAQALSERWRAYVAPRVDALEKANAWHSARTLLSTGLRTWADAVDLPRTGLSPVEIDAAIAKLAESDVGPRREALDAAWNALDLELVRWVDARAAELSDLLASRRIDLGRAELESSWAAELAARELDPDAMPAGLLHRGLEAFARHARELDAAAAKYAEEDARLALAEIERETRAARTARRFGEAARLFEAARTQAIFAPVAEEITRRARIADELQALIDDAASWIAENDGRTLSLRLGAIPITGRLSCPRDPREHGFQLVLDGGRVLALSLHRDGAATNASPLASEDLERLAELGARRAATFDPARQRLRALLFRLEENDIDGARLHLDAGPLPSGDPLVRLAEERVREASRQAHDDSSARRLAALERLHVVRRLLRSRSADAEVVRRAEALLADYPDELSADESAELRRERDERLARASTSSAPAARAGLAATGIDEIAPGRIRLRFDFLSARAGSFERGEWFADGAGWSQISFAATDAQMIERASPRILLGESLRVQHEPLEVRLRFVQLPDSQPNLLAVSIVGFHVIFTGASSGSRARVFVDTGDLAEAIARARDGDGREFQGWKIGDNTDLRFIVRRSRGTIQIQIDDERLPEIQRTLPRGDPQAAAFVVRAREPLRLVSATIEATKR